MMSFSFVRPAAALALAAAFTQPALANQPQGFTPQLDVGPLIGGQNFFVHARTSTPNGFVALLLGIDGTPTTVGAFQPIYGMNLALSIMYMLPTDATGRMFIDVPTLPGTYGPTGQDVPFFFQVVEPVPGWVRRVSPVRAVRVEPSPSAPGFMVDVAATNLPSEYMDVGAVFATSGDVNRDGHTDLVFFGGVGGDEIRVWTNDGTGVFTDETALHFPTFTPWPAGDLALVDIDGDGRLDLLIAGGYDPGEDVPDTLWRNDGLGVFTRDFLFPEGEGRTHSFEVADLDGDGHMDVVTGVGASTHLPTPGGKDRLHFSDGAGGYIESVAFRDAAFNDPMFTTMVIRAGDIDNDGDLDLVVGRQDPMGLDGIPGQPNLLLLNDGVGGFTDVSSLRFDIERSDNTRDLALADLDLDGDLDIVVANSLSSVIPAADAGELYWNQGGIQGGTIGFFVEDSTSALELSTPADMVRLAVRVADVDGDGTPDILMGVHDLFLGADQLLFLNQGGVLGGTLGTFARQFWFDPGDFICYAIEPFDMDHDGDIDVAMFASGVVAGDPDLGLRVLLIENTIQ